MQRKFFGMAALFAVLGRCPVGAPSHKPTKSRNGRPWRERSRRSTTSSRIRGSTWRSKTERRGTGFWALEAAGAHGDLQERREEGRHQAGDKLQCALSSAPGRLPGLPHWIVTPMHGDQGARAWC